MVAISSPRGSVMSLCHEQHSDAPLQPFFDTEPSDARIRDAVAALGALGEFQPTSTATPSTSSIYGGYSPSSSLDLSRTSTHEATPNSSTSSFPCHEDSSDTFIDRVSQLPLVNTALRVYDTTKKSSRIINVRTRIDFDLPPIFECSP